ncbi:HvfC/BufC N-terminal domain-containing protein [Phenylobacterium soli]|uniref:DUF2063 domain-containing protein n=1 Tax=Phenylobacterium soli TaxID=2170551 RepID=A0A328AHB1_9CAUL|nr:DNA-binding domain-containing protein [Phenylobacterium soli]RAK53907.1 DUF2063 domain-containing protein [Phenylobacterium soli]
MRELSAFQDAFSEALAGDIAPLAPWLRGADGEARVSVYRNTVAKGCADALAAQFPTVERVVGEAWMRQAGVIFARAHPPSRPSLHAYGEAFPDWLAGFAPAREMPFLPDLARIDWAWTCAEFAADARPLAPAALADLAAEDFASHRAEPHPAAGALWFDCAIPSLWRALQGEAAPDGADLEAEPQGLLLTRPSFEVETRVLGRGAVAFFAACRQGASLALAAEAALEAQPDLPLATTFAELIAAGAFSRLLPL